MAWCKTENKPVDEPLSIKMWQQWLKVHKKHPMAHTQWIKNAGSCCRSDITARDETRTIAFFIYRFKIKSWEKNRGLIYATTLSPICTSCPYASPLCVRKPGVSIVLKMRSLVYYQCNRIFQQPAFTEPNIINDMNSVETSWNKWLLGCVISLGQLRPVWTRQIRRCHGVGYPPPPQHTL